MNHRNMILVGLCVAASLAPASPSTADGARVGAEHRWQQHPSPNCETASAVVTLSSLEAAQTANFEFAQVQEQPMSRSIHRNAEIAYNANRYARLSSRAQGVVAEILKDLGEHVTKGEVIAVVDSSDLGTAKAELLQATATVSLWEANVKRERELLEKGVGIEREVLEAETRLAEARISASKAHQRLRNLGLSQQQIHTVQLESDTSSLLSVTASFDAMVVERTAAIGEVVSPGQPVISIADTSMMWAVVDLAESDLADARLGQEATVTIDGLAGRAFFGQLKWISTQVDPRSRTVKARVHLENNDGMLRANMYGRASIAAGASRAVLTVPKTSVQWEGCCNIAFTRTNSEGTQFRPVRLVLDYDAGDRYEVRVPESELRPGDFVVTAGSFILKNEILKNAVGAGCCEVDHLKK